MTDDREHAEAGCIDRARDEGERGAVREQAGSQDPGGARARGDARPASEDRDPGEPSAKRVRCSEGRSRGRFVPW